ncbi:MAG: trypsin-like peptidase domain-containing protein [Ardenticatenales bacterium]|nr:trypsin-like peptidase domain-containing protein [Ardenticatenales bacterium]
MSRAEKVLMYGCGALALAIVGFAVFVGGALVLRNPDLAAGRLVRGGTARVAPALRDDLTADDATTEARADVPGRAQSRASGQAARGDVERPARNADRGSRALSAAESRRLDDAIATKEAPPALRALPLPATQSGLGDRSDLPALFEAANPGVVSIQIGMAAQFQADQAAGEGSGFLIDERHVVTNFHVAGQSETVGVVFFDGTTRTGRVVGGDAYSDLAVIEVDDVPDNVRSLPLLRDFDTLRVGESVVAIGNPFGLANTMTAGIISALGRLIPDTSSASRYGIPQAIQTDAPINPGNSGGPLLNMRGEVIGVNAQIRPASETAPVNAGVGFAIPASIVARVAPALIKDGRYRWPFLGVQGRGVTDDVVAANRYPEDTKGAYILQTICGGPSDGALEGDVPCNVDLSLRAAQAEGGGDLVIAVEGEPLSDFDDLLTYVATEASPGQTLELTVLRDGERVRVQVTPGERPQDAGVPRQQLQQP